MPCACQNKRQSFEVVQSGGTGRVAFTSSSQGTSEAVADRYAKSIVRDKKTGDPVYHSWPKGSYEVVLQAGAGEVVFTGTERNRLKASADDHAGAVVRSTANRTVVYPLAAALAANPAA
ncbi:hypothetical protein [Streptomyces sp. NPDC102437]|uniref:hypothetical protein n=1 Tax=Streptomyces sp. NPDC102437 TaxID=3366175 RepID=UPI0037FBBE9C